MKKIPSEAQGPMDAIMYSYKHLMLASTIQDIKDVNRVSGGRWPKPRTAEAHILELYRMGVPLRFIEQWASERVMSEAMEDYIRSVVGIGFSKKTRLLFNRLVKLNPEAWSE